MSIDEGREDKGKGKVNSTKIAQSIALPWVEKYRPTCLDQVLSQPHITTTIHKFISDSRLPHLLFYGPPGTGKTSCANAICCTLYGPSWRSSGQVLDLNASDERGIDVVRDQIKLFAETKGLCHDGWKQKLVILDEADAMTGPAQNALRRVMEKYVKHVRFIILCNYASQIIPALQSRCTRFRFSPLKPTELHDKLRQVCQAERVILTGEAEGAVVRLAGGDMRRVLNVLQAAAAACNGSVVDDALIHAITATAHPSILDDAFKSLLSDPLQQSFERVHSICRDHSLSLADLVSAMFERVCAYEMPVRWRADLLAGLADAEWRVCGEGGADRIQLWALAGVFSLARFS